MRDVPNFCALWDDRSNNGGGKVADGDKAR